MVEKEVILLMAGHVLWGHFTALTNVYRLNTSVELFCSAVLLVLRVCIDSLKRLVIEFMHFSL